MSDGTTSFFQVRNGQDGSATWDQINSKAPIITETVTGAIANFPDGADDIPVADLVVNIEPKQSGSGDPSPSNIRPISGWTGCNVTRCGKNRLKLDRTAGTATGGLVSPRTFDFDCLYVGITANNYFGSGNINSYSVTSSSLTVNIKNRPYGIGYPLSVTPGTTYYLSFTCSGSGEVRIGYYDANGNYLSSTGAITASGSFTPPSGAYIADIVFSCTSSTVGTSLTYSSIQVEHGSTATTYEPYQSTSLAVDWTTEAGTVYGGTIDVATGVLTVTDANIASYAGETLPSTWISDRDVYAEGTTPTTGAQVVYTLSTSQTYQLSGQQLKTLYGTNNVWADTGNVTVTYPADTKMYIDNAIAALA